MRVWGSFQGVSMMFQGSFRGVLRDLNGWFKGASKYLKEVKRLCLGSFKDVLRKFQGCLKKVPSVFQENLIKSLKGISSIFQWKFVLQFCCSMVLILFFILVSLFVYPIQRLFVMIYICQRINCLILHLYKSDTFWFIWKCI